MPALLLVIIIVVVILLVLGLSTGGSQNKKLAKIRERWGKPIVANRRFNLISAYLDNCDDNYISNNTAADLDLDDLFEYLDRTNSRPGQQYLYKQLHMSAVSETYLDKLEQQIAHVNRDKELRELAELKLSDLNNSNAYYLPGLFSKLQQPLFNPLLKAYISMAPFLTVGFIISLIIRLNQYSFVLLLIMVIANVGIHFLNKMKTLGYTPSLPQLLILYKVGDWLAEKKLLENTDDVKNSLNHVAKLKRSLSFINLQSKIDSDPTDVSFLITEWFKILLLLEPFMFIISIDRVNKYLADIKTLYEAVARVDMAIAIQSVREGALYYCKPKFTTDRDNILIKDLYHPLIDNCVPNSISIDNKQGVLITGSNMSGKTTFIRAAAINAIVAQTINTSFARGYSSPPLQIHTSINMSDDLGESKSYFQAEALSIKTIIDDVKSGHPINSLVIIDEIFRGTNTIERVAAAKAVLSYFIKNKGFVFVSTHDLELAELLGEDYKVFSFEEIMGDDQLIFDYKIKEGLLKNKNGIAVLQRLGYPETIIDEANKLSIQLRAKYDLN
ncbi:MAG: hypothetical protein V4553_20575 [Bacteroidota bacterium]